MLFQAEARLFQDPLRPSERSERVEGSLPLNPVLTPLKSFDWSLRVTEGGGTPDDERRIPQPVEFARIRPSSDFRRRSPDPVSAPDDR